MNSNRDPGSRHCETIEVCASVSELRVGDCAASITYPLVHFAACTRGTLGETR